LRERERERVMVLYILLVAKEDLDLEAFLEVFHGRIILAHTLVGRANRVIISGDIVLVNPGQTHSQHDFLGFLKMFQRLRPHIQRGVHHPGPLECADENT